MKLMKSLLLTLAASSVLVAGCSPLAPLVYKFKSKEIHVPTGAVAEIRAPIVVPVWYHDKEGNVKKGYVNAWAGYLVGPGTPAQPVKNSEIK